MDAAKDAEDETQKGGGHSVPSGAAKMRSPEEEALAARIEEHQNSAPRLTKTEGESLFIISSLDVALFISTATTVEGSCCFFPSSTKSSLNTQKIGPPLQHPTPPDGMQPYVEVKKYALSSLSDLVVGDSDKPAQDKEGPFTYYSVVQ